MQGRKPGKTGGVFAGLHLGFFRAENDADGRGSFAAVERSLSDRLLRKQRLPVVVETSGGTFRRRFSHFQFMRHRRK